MRRTTTASGFGIIRAAIQFFAGIMQQLFAGSAELAVGTVFAAAVKMYKPSDQHGFSTAVRLLYDYLILN
jgi:hypothetical protein